MLKKICLLCGALGLAASACPALAAGKMQLSYEVYMGGLKAVSANIVIDEQENGDFQITTFGRTLGLIDTMYPFRGTYMTQGKIKDGRITLTKSSGRRQVRKSVKETILFYNGKGENIQRINISGKEKTTYDQSEKLMELSKDGLDYNSIFLQVLKHVEKGGCTFDTAVWSGKKRTGLFFKTEPKDKLKKASMSKFYGDVKTCSFTVEGTGDNSEDTWFWKTSGDGTKEAVPVKSWYQEKGDLPFPVLVRAQHTIDLGMLIIYLTDAKKL